MWCVCVCVCVCAQDYRVQGALQMPRPVYRLVVQQSCEHHMQPPTVQVIHWYKQYYILITVANPYIV